MLEATLTTSASLTASGGTVCCSCCCSVVDGCLSSGRVFFFCGCCGGVRRDCASDGRLETGMRRNASARAAADVRLTKETFMATETSKAEKAGALLTLKLNPNRLDPDYTARPRTRSNGKEVRSFRCRGPANG